MVPIALLIPGAPSLLGPLTQVLPSGLAAALSVGLVSGSPIGLVQGLELLVLLAWFAAFLLLGFRMSRNHFYEVIQVMDSEGSRDELGKVTTRLETAGRSVWSVVRLKERLVMVRTKERRALLINALFLSGFMLIYSLSGVFQSSPTSFLFILFIIGSFGAGSATRWLEKERLWIIKTSDLDLRGYVRQVYRARVAPLLLVLTPVTVAVGLPLVISDLGKEGTLLSIILSLPGALEIATITMGGGMYFASKYGQSTTDDILTSQTQDLTDIRRFLYQTAMNLALVAPLMGLVIERGVLADPVRRVAGLGRGDTRRGLSGLHLCGPDGAAECSGRLNQEERGPLGPGRLRARSFIRSRPQRARRPSSPLSSGRGCESASPARS